MRSALLQTLAALTALMIAPAAATAGAASIAALAASCPAPPNGAATAALYLTLKNVGAEEDRLLGASSPSAQKVELHSMSMAGGVMRMRPVTEGVALAPGATLSMRPSEGLHLMLIHPNVPLTAGRSITVDLRFAKAGVVSTRCVVGSGEAAATQTPMKM